MNATTYGLDVAKRVFQMYWVDAQTGEIVNRRFGRDELIGFLAQRPAGRVALEACGSGHWWARKIMREVSSLVRVAASHGLGIRSRQIISEPESANMRTSG
jgi:transposase